MKYIYFLIFMIIFTGCSSKYQNLSTVKTVDIQRYLGTWYEVGRYENSFEKGCIGASATYTLDKDKSLKVLNRCYDENGQEIASAMGKAYSVDTTNTKLKVSFFWPFYGDYWIIKLAEDYRYSIVSEPRKKYLWILSRSKELTSKDRKEILYFLREEGFNTENIFWTKLDKIL